MKIKNEYRLESDEVVNELKEEMERLDGEDQHVVKVMVTFALSVGYNIIMAWGLGNVVYTSMLNVMPQMTRPQAHMILMPALALCLVFGTLMQYFILWIYAMISNSINRDLRTRIEG